MVEFKQSNKNSPDWKVVGIETDFQACRWTNGGKRPLFLKLERVTTKAGKQPRKEHVWTFTSALKAPKELKGAWVT